MHKYFVWITGLQGPEPQLWADKQVDGGGKAKGTLFIHELSASEQGLSLSTFALMYPLEAVK